MFSHTEVFWWKQLNNKPFFRMMVLHLHCRDLNNQTAHACILMPHAYELQLSDHSSVLDSNFCLIHLEVLVLLLNWGILPLHQYLSLIFCPPHKLGHLPVKWNNCMKIPRKQVDLQVIHQSRVKNPQSFKLIFARKRSTKL